jgi:hypothetical protein
MRQVNEIAIPFQAAATLTSAAIPALNLFSCSVQITATGSAAGTLAIQASNDDSNAANFVPTNWSAIPNATVTVTGAGAFLIPKTDLCYQWVRVVYTNSGTGTVAVVFKALGD